MNSNIPTRRVTRATRTTVLRDKENATARAVGRTTRAKPSSSSVAPVDVKPSGIARATASTAATRAKTVRVDPAAQGKRKREALGEVAKPSENKARLVNTGPIPLKENERVKEI
ncbi:hypothetical protein A0H81_02539 [Grifola frondosa]|uniref:Uncharacterized protein n=1 Tax=Grifola frondosa TaxID=5627 RepID=A0A1C7MLV1_GRIFR|nr:hypothetical protein A0H81_02539 [Grifola frondosa]